MADPIVNATPSLLAYRGSASVPYMKMFFNNAVTSGGVATVYPTTTGTATGTALFSQIFHSDCTAWASSSTAIGSILSAGKTISADLRTVSFNLVGGTGVLLGGTSLAFAPDNTAVSVVIYGA